MFDKCRLDCSQKKGAVQLSFATENILDRKLMPLKKIQPEEALSAALMTAPETVADLIPKEADYIWPVFRAISKAYLGAGGYYLDFSRADVLESSLPLFLDRPRGGSRKKALKLQRNHSFDVEDTLGYIDQAEWDTSPRFPAPGINVVAGLDWKIAPQEARGLLSKPPLIDSVSISVAFDWEPSHPDLPWWQFFDLLGHELDGEVVRIIVTEILELYHIGLVWQGGDENADVIDTQPEKENNEGGLQQFVYAWQDGEGFSAAKKERPPEKPLLSSNPNWPGHANSLKYTLNKKECGFMKELTISNLAPLLAALQVDSLTGEEDLVEKIKLLSEANAELRENVAELKDKAKIADQYLASERKEVLRLAGILKDGEPEETLLKMVEDADLETLQYFKRDFGKQVAEKFPEGGRSSVEELETETAAANDVDEAEYITGK